MKSKKPQIAIQLTKLSKKYEIHHEKPTLVEKFVKGPNETFWALKNIDLTILKGERVGIIGPNGSGKTTLLKIIAGITTPTTGAVVSNGKITSLIDLDAGFHQDLTGIQNIYLSGMLIGMKRDEIDKKAHSIIRYAGIRQFIDAPLFTYSSGMKLRLGFAVAIHNNPDILLLDEGIYVGDQYFQKKIEDSLKRFLSSNHTLVFVSHWPELLKPVCKTIYWMSGGCIYKKGGLSIIDEYTHLSG